MSNIQPLSTDFKLWIKTFPLIQITNLLSMFFWVKEHNNKDGKEIHNGYVLSDNYGRNYVYGKEVCEWFSKKHIEGQLQLIPELNDKKIIQAGYGCNFFVLLTDDGKAYLGGENDFWETDNKLIELTYYDQNDPNSNSNERDSFPPPIKKSKRLKKFKQIACGHSHLLLLTEDDELLAMGSNEYGQITEKDDSYDKIINITELYKDLGKVKKMVCGRFCSLALNQDGKIFSWGRNHHGQLALENDQMGDQLKNLGNDNYEDHRFPKQNRFFKKEEIIDIAAGRGHFLFLTDEGLYGCGANYYGQLGRENKNIPKRKRLNRKEDDKIKIPIRIELWKKVTSIAPIGWPYHFSMAFTDDNDCYVWGYLKKPELFEPTKTKKPVKSFSEASSLYFKMPMTFGWTSIFQIDDNNQTDNNQFKQN